MGQVTSPFTLKKEMELKKVLDIELKFEYNEFIKSEEWFLAHLMLECEGLFK